MVCSLERALGVALAIPLLWLGGCGAAAKGSGGSGGFPATLGTGGTPAMGGSGLGPTPMARAGTGGTTGFAPMNGVAGGGGTAGMGGLGVAGTGPAIGTGGTTGGMAGITGMTGSGGTTGAAGMGGTGTGACCASGDCLCHGPSPTALSSMAGPFKTMSYMISTGTVYYPVDADPPFAAVAIIPGFLNTGPEMAPWGPFYASWGIVLADTNSGAADTPDIRAGELLAAIKELKAENTKTGSPLFGKLSDRYGTSGYSMGGGGTTIAASMEATLKTSVGLAPWGGVGMGVTVPTLLFCGDADTVAPCNMATDAYTGMTGATPRMLMTVPGATHFNWFDPADAGGGMSGKYALAFQKVYLEGDERWKPLLAMMPTGGSVQSSNIK
jgi:hypothetical protein